MYSNLVPLTSSTLLEKIKVSAGQLGLGNDTFSSICGTFFSGKSKCQFNLGHMSYLFNVWSKDFNRSLLCRLLRKVSDYMI